MNDIKDKYSIKECIHNSDKSDIYLGSIEGIGNFRRNIVLKRYKHLSDKEFQTLSQDAKQASVLTHANIVQVLDLGQWEGDWTIIMEHVSGLLLSDFITFSFTKDKRIPDHIIFHITLEILKGLEYAHQRLVQNNMPALLHLNLCPNEILLDIHGNIKIKGFSTVLNIPNNSRFFPPELTFDHRTDIWGVGAVLRAMLVGLDAVDPLETYTSAPRNALERIASQATHPNPDKRFQSAAAMKEALITQCGGIDLQGAQKLANFMQPHIADFSPDPFEQDISDLPTYVSKTISQEELAFLKDEALRMQKEENSVLHSTPSSSSSISSKQNGSFLISILSFIFGVMLASLGWLLFPQLQTSDVIFYFPADVTIELNDQKITTSGSKHMFPSDQPLTAQVNMPNGVVQELKIQLKAGETRLIMIENIALQ